METKSTKSLLLGLFCSNPHKLPGNYPELNSIRRRAVEEKSYHRPYSSNKGKVRIYQGIFLGIGFLFLILAGVANTRTASWHCNLYFANGVAIKTLMGSFALLLSISAFGLAFSMRPERETVAYFVKRAKRNLHRTYMREKGLWGWKRFLLFGEKQSQLRHTYLEIKDRLKERGEETLLLMGQIKRMEEYDRETKESLFNKALLELHDQLHSLTQSFCNRTTSKYS